MPAKRLAEPPRPIAPGDVVVAYSEELGEWTAAQIIAVDPDRKEADVLELDWSGPEPADIGELGELTPLFLTHHDFRSFAQMHREWVLPRSHRVIGSARLLVTARSRSFRQGWDTGQQLYWQRRWDAGERGEDDDHSFRRLDSAAIEHQTDGRSGTTSPDIRNLAVDVQRLDCTALVGAFPNLTRLTLWGAPGRLDHLVALNQLHALRTLHLFDVFGMTEADLFIPASLPHLEYLHLESVPVEFATAMRKAWAPEVRSGVYLSVTKARRPGWVEDNLNNPLRTWDGREGISPAAYRRALAAWTKTTAPIRQALLDAPAEDLLDRLAALGREFARAFDGIDGRSHLIETQERDELLEALHGLITTTPTAGGVDRERAASVTLHAVNQERSW